MDLKKLKGKKKGFTLIELMVVIVIIGILVAIALPNFIAAQDRAKLSSVKANMHTVQTVVETYAVDFGGVYADTLSALNSEAVTKSYWKDFKNPFSGKTGVGNAWMTDMTLSVDSTTGVTATGFVPGSVGYNPTRTTGNPITLYFVYGGEKASDKVLLDKGVAFYLTNQ